MKSHVVYKRGIYIKSDIPEYISFYRWNKIKRYIESNATKYYIIYDVLYKKIVICVCLNKYIVYVKLSKKIRYKYIFTYDSIKELTSNFNLKLNTPIRTSGNHSFIQNDKTHHIDIILHIKEILTNLNVSNLFFRGI